MLALRELQSAFRQAIFHGGDDVLLAYVQGSGVAPARRVAVYRGNVLHNYSEALRAVYPVVERLVGEAFFVGAGREYIVTHPSRSGDLHDYGDKFGEFLDSFEHAAILPYLGDVARLEWLWHECFHAAEQPPLSLQRLAGVANDSLDTLCLHLHPACRLLASRYPVSKIWFVNQPDWHGAKDVDLNTDGDSRLLLRRDGFAVVIEDLGVGEFEMLLALARGEPLVGACTKAGAADRGCDPVSFLQRMLGYGVLVGFDFSTK